MRTKRKKMQDFLMYVLPGDLNTIKGGAMSIPLDNIKVSSSALSIIIIDTDVMRM